MQATLYVSEEVLTTAKALKDLSYADRAALEDDPAHDLSMSPGYFLKNANKLKLAALPHDAVIACRITPDYPLLYRKHLSAPTNLRGVIYEKAPHIHPLYRDIVTFWSGDPINAGSTSAVYHQNKLNEYMVDLSALEEAEHDESDGDVLAAERIDKLLSEGVVIQLADVESLIANLSLHYFIEIAVPVNHDMLGIECDDFLSENSYMNEAGQQFEYIYLKVADILRSPDHNCIFIDLIQHSMINYGYYY